MDPKELKRQLLATFQIQLNEHIATMNKGLLALEKGGPSEEKENLMAELFRAAHSVKGAARAVELWDIQTMAHRLEDVLGALQREELAHTQELFDLILQAVDALGEAMDAHLRGERYPADKQNRLLTNLDAALKGAMESETRTDKESDIQEGRDTEHEDMNAEGPEDREPEEAEEAVPPSQTAPLESESLGEDKTEKEMKEEGPVAPRPYRVPASGDTIRVTTAKLDTLMAGMGELLVARMRTEQRLGELKNIQGLLDGWKKTWRKVRIHHIQMQRRNGRGPDLSPLLDFLTLNEGYLKEIQAGINQLINSFGSDYHHLALLTDDLQSSVRRVRMVPVSTLFDLFPRMVRDIAREQGKKVVLSVEGAHTEVDRQVLEAMKDPLTHLLRNAVDHGIELPKQREALDKAQTGTIHLRASQSGGNIVLEVADDGAGIDLEAVRRSAEERGFLSPQELKGISERETMDLIFLSGLSTRSRASGLSGRGIGMDVVRENMEQLQGIVHMESNLHQGTVVTLTLPLTMATSHVLLLEVAGQTVAVPTTTVERTLKVDADQVGSIEGKPAILMDGRPLPLASLSRVLELAPSDGPAASERKLSVVVLGAVEKRLAFRVDGLKNPQEVVIKNLGRQLCRVRNVAGATILGTGQVVMILNVAALMKSAQAVHEVSTPGIVETREAVRRRVLVVDDSITTRTLEKNILENAGYRVIVAANGQEALSMVQSEPLDAVVADVAMPVMDGFELTEKVKGDERWEELPVVLVTSLESPQDKIRGMEAGADAYITKGSFDQQELLETIERLIG